MLGRPNTNRSPSALMFFASKTGNVGKQERALVPNSFLLLLVRHLLLVAWHLFLLASCFPLTRRSPNCHVEFPTLSVLTALFLSQTPPFYVGEMYLQRIR